MLFLLIPLAVLAVALAAAGLVFMMFFNLWVQAKASAVPISLLDMLCMRLRGVEPAAVVRSTVALSKAGLQVSPADLETHILAGGNMGAVADALISASKADLDMDFARLAAIDLAGRDVVAAVAARVNPKVVLCPVRGTGQHMITGVAQDGVRIGVKARVTVRTQLSRLVGGAGEETIVARVGEGIVAAIGRARTHREILERPEIISAFILSRGLDSGTCFEILSVDIADLDVLDNIGARLQSSQADADKRIAQAQAEVRRAAAVAAHHEMTARTTEMQSRVVTAKSTVPLALASALDEANLGRPNPLRTFINTRLRWRALGDG